MADNIEFYTGVNGKQIIQAEKYFYTGDCQLGLNELKVLLENENVTSNERVFIENLRKCYSLNIPASDIQNE